MKYEVRDLCMLRMTHAFCEAGPMLLIQLYVIWHLPSVSYLSDLKIVSTALSLSSVCWALASFNKNIRRKNIHKLVLTWLGVIFQFMWHLGTVSSRVIALTVYATLYNYWVFLVIGLHWISMFLWLMSPKNVFHGERISCTKRAFFSMLIAYVYVFCYVNLQEINSCQKMAAFFTTMFLENTLLIAVWLGQSDPSIWYHYPVIVVVFGSFFTGIFFMILYYRFFHFKRLKNFHDEDNNHVNVSCANCQVGKCRKHPSKFGLTYIIDNSINDKISYGEMQLNGQLLAPGIQHGISIPPTGVFNCRLNPALKRKKKKPTSFIPPPSAPVMAQDPDDAIPLNGSRDRLAFWKQPLPISLFPSLKSSYHHHGSSDLDASSVGSRVNIQQKLQEKRKQQLQELQEIQEEIKQGKLHRPFPAEISEQGTLRQPIPRSKKQPWLRPQPPVGTAKQENISYGYTPSNSDYTSGVIRNMGFGKGKNRQRSKTPEILLSPHYLENSRIYHHYNSQPSHWKDPTIISEAMSNMPNYVQSKMRCQYIPSSQVTTAPAGDEEREDWQSQNKNNEVYKSCRVPSDLDSQISLPRSYTLPREFKYYHQHRAKSRKVIRSDHFFMSTNSSDGDVDSADDNDHRCMWSPPSVSSHQCYPNYGQYKYVHGRNAAQGKHETQL